MHDVDERVQVTTTVTGLPLHFQWRERNYRATQHPVRFFTRRPWWTEQDRVHKGIGAQVLETEVWRLTAVGRGRSAERVYELTREAADWRLARILG
ncbi:DUF6504 family protein [Specibacter sp. RAF43]|uniref:DUF6504 family protein n=1 Tax=Specibacter sp. RAF43 TaxID=3233057 RepID=UPI003F9ABB1C